MSKLLELKKELKSLADKEQSRNLQRFFKTGKGEYGEGDIFLGIKVPVQRNVAKKYTDLNLKYLQILLNSKIHEYRFIALIILIKKSGVSSDALKEIFGFYIKNSKNVNNWDLVDISAPHIVGRFLSDKSNRKILYKFAKSKNLWEKRIAIISTFSFIRENQFQDTLKIAEILLSDDHDLIHKAVGWMLREVGNRDRRTEEIFLKKYYKKMPRTMLRYAIEKFPKDLRVSYLKDIANS
jgi:3-methyladenine DNA glycosylase AlkD